MEPILVSNQLQNNQSDYSSMVSTIEPHQHRHQLERKMFHSNTHIVWFKKISIPPPRKVFLLWSSPPLWEIPV